MKQRSVSRIQSLYIMEVVITSILDEDPPCLGVAGLRKIPPMSDGCNGYNLLALKLEMRLWYSVSMKLASLAKRHRKAWIFFLVFTSDSIGAIPTRHRMIRQEREGGYITRPQVIYKPVGPVRVQPILPCGLGSKLSSDNVNWNSCIYIRINVQTQMVCKSAVCISGF